MNVLALQGGLGAGAIGQLVIPFSFLVIMYFVFILPQRREQKRHREMLAALKAGQEVVTVGGLVGEIIQLKDDRVTLKSGDARVVVERARIVRVVSPSGTTR